VTNTADAANDAVARHDAPGLDLRTRIAIGAGGMLLRLLGATWRVRSHGRDTLHARSAGDPRVLYTLWHGEMLPVLYQHRVPTAVMISEHRDGEIIASIVKMFGASAFRGSSSRGGARALLEGVRLLRNGTDVAITPDGPRGPLHSYAPGALLLAYRAGVSVVPIVAHVDRAWRLRSWDAFVIPKPFARVTIVYGTPSPVAGVDARDVATQVEAFATKMHEASMQARTIADTTTVQRGTNR
jgi:lysophospholipid acyltransferase (LPLAT)-like uncharacterized protein